MGYDIRFFLISFLVSVSVFAFHDICVRNVTDLMNIFILLAGTL